MLDLGRLAEFDAALVAIAARVPGLTRDLRPQPEAPARGRGGVAVPSREVQAA